ncbi:MAG: ATP-binding cassette domain-containing protein [Dyadobacter sp.]|uniref:ABC transporter ATP-binding protein n=1 Tax=Dyadobacter sp. TaxID=1914288 RepID=UPI001B09A1A7|nr:ATP-binding cassette domain-containing protein [Dyadobacter sp.]MBO9611146.1 ATP-binding cassette domain-containing protein [Dyadobacter sp.]
MESLAIQTSALRYRHGEKGIIHDLDLRVPAGSIFGLLGPNGSGKTTTIRLLLDLLTPTSGTIRLFGSSIQKNRRQLLGNIGSLIELPTLYPHLTGLENLEMTRLLRNLPRRQAIECLELTGLDRVAHQRVSTYSLGMRQRLGIALALVGDPALLILDEPTNGLDPAGILDIRNLIINLNRGFGKTILISSHFLSEIEKIATDIAILNDGRLVYQGALNQLRSEACTPADSLESIFLTLTQAAQ